MGRLVLVGATSSLLAACAVVPKGPPETPPPAPQPAPAPLPADVARHRIALLVPTMGPNAAAGQSVANAATLALMDFNAANLRITTYDTSISAEQAAKRALADGNALILGPLLGDDAPAVARIARSMRVPVISFSNDYAVAGGNVFVIGTPPAQTIDRVVRHARAQGVTQFAALMPLGSYGERASAAVIASVRQAGGTLVAMENYDRSAASVSAAAKKLKARGGYEAVLIGDTAQMAVLAAPILRAGNPKVRILGNELWSGESAVARTPALSGAWFAALTDARFAGRFADSYKARFGAAPYRIATLGYDSVLLTLRIARDWQPGSPFPAARLYDHEGFVGLDGAFRFGANNVIERALEVREAGGGRVRVISPAPPRFDN
ncbi:ABC transporter substrate-binding protein [Novosphingobium sp. FSY-8]|uniref:ABC transporter substrate-binding protein n=1 Tax=Novosphingobium ovatum TaxID=1908523 RepID=A0ABW9XCL9_9SPHN|nr:ABC transporter substrate-binding protein [Novosphingobium ovatum]